MNKIDIKKSFENSICSFDIAKKISKLGFSTANTYFAYDERGNVTSGGWLQELGYKVYPCVNLALAYSVMEDVKADIEKISLYQLSENEFHLVYGEDEVFKGERCADAILEFWMKYKND